jgi:16S rRNA (cytosine1402-N4)-methyltransferase
LDPEAIENFKKKLRTAKIETKAENLELVNDNFACLKKILSSLKIKKVDSVIADFGISSDQIDNADRGFSFRTDAPLDMRIDPAGSLTAADIVNNYSEQDLEKTLRDYGDEKYARRIAREIIKQRKIKPIIRTLELIGLIEKTVPGFYKRQKIHFATRTFQALRIEVNKELENIKKFLPQAIDLLGRRGRLAAITFHSGEDRIVKNIFRENARGCICPPEFPVCRCGKLPKIRIITRKPIAPSEEELKENPRARSAKLRVAEKL